MKTNSFGTPEQRGNVTVYPAASDGMLRPTYGRKIRTAAYVRVSTDTIQQEGSLILQREYYEHYIKNNPEYEFVGIYEDDVTGTNVRKRKGFKKMIEDCRAGKIDLILTKSIERFARNTGDTLHYVDELKALNLPVEIRFETDGISTFEKYDEGYLMFRAMVAQEESHNKSKSITWAIDNHFEQGKYYSPAVYGYTKKRGRDNPLVINENEAKIVCLCFAMTIVGYSFHYIANILNALGIKGRRGNTTWAASGVITLLSNEKYAGKLIARKTVTPNYKTHKSKRNEGEKTQYHIDEHHDPIVPPLAREVVLRIIQNRKGNFDGIPYLKVVQEGVLKGFVIVNKALRGYTLNDYVEASNSVYKEKDNSEISIIANKVSVFDFRDYNTVSALLFDDNMKSSCTIKDSKITFNAACRKAFGTEKAEILFHPTKAILALRSHIDEKGAIALSKPINLSSFVPVALESAGLKAGYRYRMNSVKKAKNGKNIMFFDLRETKIISENGECILPDKYATCYGNGYYENITFCDLHKVDIEGLWKVSQESRPTGLLTEQIAELADFCKKSLSAFRLDNKIKLIK